ncbi:MAG: hypothetical protein JST26_11785 [Bacteroidetes bacterium]|nr:hypothetical protein [Bacteroidota bacterium]
MSTSYVRSMGLPAQALHEYSRTNTLPHPQTFSQFTYAFQYGMFLWVKATDRVSIKPEITASFSNYKISDPASRRQPTYATSTDLSIANQVVLALKPNNTHGIIKAAKCMSYYLTGKQPYLIFGPKLSFRKFDRGFIHKGFQNEATVGFVAGYGINYGFHNMNMAPEIKYGLETTAENKINNRQKFIHTISVSINLF